MADNKPVAFMIIISWLVLTVFFEWDMFPLWKYAALLNQPLTFFSELSNTTSPSPNVSAVSLWSTGFSTQPSTNLSTSQPPLIDKWALLRKFATPNANCPEKTRVGSTGDGGKWTCKPWKAARNDCVLYSLGVNGDVSFETDFYERSGYRCRVFSFDVKPQSAHLFRPFNGTFTRLRLSAKSSNGTSDERSLRDVMASFNHTRLEVLKMDIEEAEFDVLNSFMQDVEITPIKTAFCQFLVEFHAFKTLKKKIDVWLPMFEKLNRAGFRLFSTERNVECCDEFSFMHSSCFAQYGLSVG